MVTREERYQAKLCIDTLVMRMGDTAAGGLFHLLDTLLHSGKSHKPAQPSANWSR